jgi:hypothetical protein
MSSYKSSFEIFSELYNENSDLFSDCEDEVKTLIDELDELNKSAPEIVEDRILNWLELPEHTDILTAFQTRLFPGTFGPGNSESQTHFDERSPVADEILENSIQPNSEGAGGATSDTTNGLSGDTLKG